MSAADTARLRVKRWRAYQPWIMTDCQRCMGECWARTEGATVVVGLGLNCGDRLLCEERMRRWLARKPTSVPRVPRVRHA